ncbi:MAG: hypothetical protein V4450_09040 [Bacteroidota bacterium]
MHSTAKSFLLALLCLCVIRLTAQEGLITCSSEQNTDRSISIYADSKAEGEYTVKLIFTNLMGYTTTVNTDIALITVYRGRREIARLTPSKTASSFALNYRYSYFPGSSLRKRPDSTFRYLLPANIGANLRISMVSSIAETIGQKPADALLATGFMYQKTDTICAARAGMVYEAIDAVKEGEKGSEFYKSERNRIRIQQKDGTLATYSILAPIQLLVAPGETVVPGQPLAVFNKESEKYTVLFSVYYLDEKRLLADRTGDVPPAGAPIPYLYLPVFFYQPETDKGGLLLLNRRYTATHPKEIIGLELSKKDKKKLGL